MHLTGNPDSIIASLSLDIQPTLDKVQKKIPFLKRQIAPYQGAALYALALKYNTPGAYILEIGTAHGYSAAMLAEAAPNAHITTLNPDPTEAAKARKNLAEYPNVDVVEAISWEFLKTYTGPKLDMVFVDGDHKRVRMDLPWWDWLKPDGLILFHDYSPKGSYRECPPVFEAVNEFSKLLGRELDVKIVDDGGAGMAGFYKQDEKSARQIKGETIFELSRCHTNSILSYAHIEALYYLAGEVKDLEGDVVECGVTNGGSALALYLGSKKNKKQKRQLWLYDTFDGMPQPGPQDGPKALAKWQARRGEWCKGDQGKVLALAKELRVSESALQLREGDFERTIANPEGYDMALLHIDATLYRSTKLALESLYSQVIPGGIVTISGVGHWPGLQLAMNEFFATLPSKPNVSIIDAINWYWKK